MSETITCPQCGFQIEITEVMSAQLAGRIRRELEAQFDAQRTKLEEKTRAETAAKLAVEIRDRDDALKEAQARLKEAQDRELAWRRKERELLEREDALRQEREALEATTRETLAKERDKLIEQAKTRAREELGVELKDRDTQLADLRAKLSTAAETELALRKRERELTERTEQLQLEVDRRLEAERQKIREAVRKQADEEHQFRAREKDQQIDGLRKQIDELKRRAEQGSQQTQGEALEVALEDLLREAFAADRIEPVPKGVAGGDVVQRVFSAGGSDAGTILWEAKRTKNWSDGWLAKLRQDQRVANAAVSILVTTALPEGVTHFALIEGVWVCSWACATGLAAALRAGLLETAKASRALEGRHGKMEQVYQYLASPQFRHRVQGIVEAIVTMKNDLDAERRAIQKHWAKREKQIEQAVFSTAGMYGDLQGIIGGTLPEIEGMSLRQLESDG